MRLERALATHGSISGASKEIGISIAAISAYCKRHNVVLPTSSQLMSAKLRNRSGKRLITGHEEETIIKLIHEGKTAKNTAVLTGWSYETVLRVLKEHRETSHRGYPKEYWLSQNWGGYKIVDENLPDVWPKFSSIKVTLRNEYGVTKTVVFKGLNYQKGNKKNESKPKEYWLSQNWGRLRLDPNQQLPNQWSFGSGKIFKFLCDCGRSDDKIFQYVVRDTHSCGRCLAKSKSFWFSQKYHKLQIIPETDSLHNTSLHLPDEFTPNYLKSQNIKVEVICDCGKKNITRLDGLLNGHTISCGCALNESKSQASKSLYEYVKSICPDAEYSVRSIIPHRELDIFIKRLNIAIEYNGNHWHSAARRSSCDILKDYEKHQILFRLGIRSIQIYSDEWINKRPIFERYLDSLLGRKEYRKRVNKYDLRDISVIESNNFLEEHHYIGKVVGASVRIGAFYGDILVGVWVFRRIKDNIEWVRACTHHAYKLWNPHEKVLNHIINRYSPNIIITFSDNRLHNGEMYRSLGFIIDRFVSPSYSYTNGSARIHKFNFRVPAGVNEELEAAKQNFYRIYDCGKIKWSLKCN